MIKTITILLLLCILSGCSTWEYTDPWHKTVREIASTPYVLGTNDCLDKAQKFQDQWGGVILNVYMGNGKNHALNDYVDFYGRRWVIDCTSGKEYMTEDIDKTIWLHLGGKIWDYDYEE